MLFGERGNEDVGLGLGVLQQLFLGVERRPLLEAMNKAELVFGGLRKDFFRVFARFVRLFVRLLHLFYSFTLIAAGVGKVAIGVVNIVVGDIEADFSHVELVFQIGFARAGGFRDLRRELVYLPL